MKINFTDKAVIDSQGKAAISVRDGVLEYRGGEFGQSPADKIFTVYRSPATIANAANKMVGIPLTVEHVKVGDQVTDCCGKVGSAEMIDFFDESTSSKLAIKNTIDIDSNMVDTQNLKGRELSLGYNAEIRPHDLYDFEQYNIDPHHLAIVDAGRCGEGCKFLDKKGVAMKHHLAFCDAEGSLNLDQVFEIAMALPEAIKTMQLKELQKIMPKLQEIVARAKAGEMPDESDVPGDEMAGESVESDVEEVADMEAESGDKEEGAKDEDDKKEFGDADFTDAINKAVDEKLTVIEKAKGFCDSVDSKANTMDIMRAALAIEHKGVEFSDEEVGTAFKMLKKTSVEYKNFADKDASQGRFDSLLGKKLNK